MRKRCGCFTAPRVRSRFHDPAVAGGGGGSAVFADDGTDITPVNSPRNLVLAHPHFISAPDTNVDTERFGAGARAQAARSTSIGKDADCTSDGGVAIGYGSEASADATAIGSGAIASGARSICIGQGATATAQDSIVIGQGGSVTVSAVIAIGSSASATVGNTVALGASATADGTFATALGQASNADIRGVAVGQSTRAESDCVALGYNADAFVASGVAIGSNSVVSGNFGVAVGADSDGGFAGVAIGEGCTATTRSQAYGRDAVTVDQRSVVFGETTHWLDQFYIGAGQVSTTPQTSVTLNATGGSGTDIAATNLILAAGRPTGAGAGGHVIIQTAAAGATGATLRSLATIAEFTDDNKIGFHGTTPQAKATVTGSRNANPALASLLTALAARGDITDSSTLGSAGSGTENEIFHAYNASAQTGISTTDTTVDIDTVFVNSDATIFALVSGELEITDTGTYEIRCEGTSTRFSSSASYNSMEWWIEKDTGGGFARITGTKMVTYHRTDHEATGACSCTVVVGSGDKFRFRCVRFSGSSTMEVVAAGSRMMARKVL